MTDVFVPPAPPIGDTGDYAADREPVHEHIRSLRQMLASSGRRDALPGAAAAIQARIDEAQAALDAHAETAGS